MACIYAAEIEKRRVQAEETDEDLAVGEDVTGVGRGARIGSAPIRNRIRRRQLFVAPLELSIGSDLVLPDSPPQRRGGGLLEDLDFIPAQPR